MVITPRQTQNTTFERGKDGNTPGASHILYMIE